MYFRYRTVESDSSKEAKQILDDIIEIEEEESRQIEKLEQLKPEASFQIYIFFNPYPRFFGTITERNFWKKKP